MLLVVEICVIVGGLLVLKELKFEEIILDVVKLLGREDFLLGNDEGILFVGNVDWELIFRLVLGRFCIDLVRLYGNF